jgi:excinuclease UvrABC nuclease subunit
MKKSFKMKNKAQLELFKQMESFDCASVCIIKGVYAIFKLNILNQKGYLCYIGSSCNINRRLKSHEFFRKIPHSNDMSIYAAKFFKCEENFIDLEIELIKKHKPPYNKHYKNVVIK